MKPSKTNNSYLSESSSAMELLCLASYSVLLYQVKDDKFERLPTVQRFFSQLPKLTLVMSKNNIILF